MTRNGCLGCSNVIMWSGDTIRQVITVHCSIYGFFNWIDEKFECEKFKKMVCVNVEKLTSERISSAQKGG